MPEPSRIARLESRAIVALGGPEWRGFLQGLITQDVETLTPGELRFGALLTPQGRLLFDLFIIGRADGCALDCAADRRAALIQRLSIYRLRAKVEIVAEETAVWAAWVEAPAHDGWLADPRAAALGWRGYDIAATATASDADYDAHRLAFGARRDRPTGARTGAFRSRRISTCWAASTSARAVSSDRKPHRA